MTVLLSAKVTLEMSGPPPPPPPPPANASSTAVKGPDARAAMLAEIAAKAQKRQSATAPTTEADTRLETLKKQLAALPKGKKATMVDEMAATRLKTEIQVRQDYLKARLLYTQPRGFDEQIYLQLGADCAKTGEVYPRSDNTDEDRLAIADRLKSHPEITTFEQYKAAVRLKPCEPDLSKKAREAEAESAKKSADENQRIISEQTAKWQLNGPQTQLRYFWTPAKNYITQQQAKYRPDMTPAEQAALSKRIIRDTENNIIAGPWRASFGTIAAWPPYWQTLKETGTFTDPFTAEVIDFNVILPGWNYVAPQEQMTLEDALLRIKELEEIGKIATAPTMVTPEAKARISAEEGRLTAELETVRKKVSELQSQLSSTTCSIKAKRIEQELQQARTTTSNLFRGLFEVRDILQNKLAR